MKDRPNGIVAQFIRFSIVGVSNVVVGYVLNVVTLLALRPLHVGWDYLAGNIVSFLLGVLWVFYWNYRFVFRVDEGKISWKKMLLKTYITYGISGIILANILSYVWIDVFDISKYIAPILNLVVTIPCNFLLNKFWAFRQKK